MRMSAVPLGGCVALATLVLSIGACHHASPATDGAATLRIGVPTVAVVTRGAGIANVVGSLTSESLMGTAPDGRQTARLATDWQWNEDRTKLHISLRQGVTFHSGTQLTGEVVAQSLRRSIENKDGIAMGSVGDVRPSGAHAVDLTLKHRDAFLLSDLSAIEIKPPGNAADGAGPFKLVESSDSVFRVDAFNHYYRGQPPIGRIEVRAYPTQRSGWAALMRGEVDMLHEVSRDALEFVEAETAVRTYSFPRPYYYLMAFNLRHPVLQDREVRRAMNLAIDRDVIVQEGLRGRGRPATTPIWPEFWSRSGGTTQARPDADAAQRALDAAGYPVRVGADRQPKRFSFTCLVWADDNRLERLALVLQKQLLDIGIDMKLQAVKNRDLVSQAAAGNFDAFLFEMANARTLGWVNYFWHSPKEGAASANLTGYSGADEALDQIRTARSDQEIVDGTRQLEQAFLDDPPALFLAWQTQSRAVSANFNVVAEPNRDILSTIWQWRLGAPELRAAR